MNTVRCNVHVLYIKDSQGYQHQKKISEKIIIPICVIVERKFMYFKRHADLQTEIYFGLCRFCDLFRRRRRRRSRNTCSVDI